MISLTTIGLFAAASLVLAITPGPDLLYIATRSVAQGRSAGVVSALGVHTGVLIHTFAAALGLSALIAASATAFRHRKIRRRGLLDLSRSEDAVKQGRYARNMADRPVETDQGLLSGADNQYPQPKGNSILFGLSASICRSGPGQYRPPTDIIRSVTDRRDLANRYLGRTGRRRYRLLVEKKKERAKGQQVGHRLGFHHSWNRHCIFRGKEIIVFSRPATRAPDYI